MSIKGLEWKQADPEKLQRVFEAVPEVPTATKEIVKAVGLNHSSVDNYLFILRKRGLVVMETVAGAGGRGFQRRWKRVINDVR